MESFIYLSVISFNSAQHRSDYSVASCLLKSGRAFFHRFINMFCFVLAKTTEGESTGDGPGPPQQQEEAVLDDWWVEH